MRRLKQTHSKDLNSLKGHNIFKMVIPFLGHTVYGGVVCVGSEPNMMQL